MSKVQPSIKVTVKDDRWQAILSALTADLALELEVGLLDEDSAIAEYGFYNEFGTDTIPERSFIRSTFDENRGKYLRALDRLLQKSMTSASPIKSALTKLGIKQRNDIIKKITKLKLPANALSTQRAKGRSLSKGKKKTVLVDNPLIDTGIMRGTIRFRIKRP